MELKNNDVRRTEVVPPLRVIALSVQKYLQIDRDQMCCNHETELKS